DHPNGSRISEMKAGPKDPPYVLVGRVIFDPAPSRKLEAGSWKLLAGSCMGQGSRPERVADQIRAEVSTMIARDLQDPGIGFMTITRVEVSPDLQHARVYYTTLGD